MSAAIMRTITGAIEYLREKDPQTDITEHFLRVEIRAGRLPGVRRAGKKYLLNMEALEYFLAGEESETVNVKEFGKLRKVSF